MKKLYNKAKIYGARNGSRSKRGAWTQSNTRSKTIFDHIKKLRGETTVPTKKTPTTIYDLQGNILDQKSIPGKLHEFLEYCISKPWK